jgi:hypothetical protein
MKLYTEEQVRELIRKTYCGDFYDNDTPDDLVNELTPIELPSDEEIENHIEDNFLKAKNVHKYTEMEQLLMKVITIALVLYGQLIKLNNKTMENKRVTALEWLENKLIINGSGATITFPELFEQAKQMEKEQMIDAYYEGKHSGFKEED